MYVAGDCLTKAADSSVANDSPRVGFVHLPELLPRGVFSRDSAPLFPGPGGTSMQSTDQAATLPLRKWVLRRRRHNGLCNERFLHRNPQVGHLETYEIESV